MGNYMRFESSLWSYNYYIGSQRVFPNTFINELNSYNKTAGQMFKSGRNLSVTGNILGSIGGFCLGFDVGARLGGGKGNAALLLGGGGVMLVGIFMSRAGKEKMKEALTLHKDDVTTLYIIPTQTGIGLCFNF